MTTTTNGGGITPLPPSGNPLIDGMLSGVVWQATPDTPVTITYAFQATPQYPSIDANQFAPLNAEEQSMVLAAMKQFSAVANITFAVAPQSSAEVLFGTDYQSPSVGLTTFATSSFTTGLETHDVVDFGSNSIGSTLSLFLAMHELGNATGLADYDQTQPNGTPDTASQAFTGINGSHIPQSENNASYSVMTFYPLIGAGELVYPPYQTTLMINDIAALQYLYGANPHTNAGTVVFSFGNTPDIEAIYAATGYHTIDMSGVTAQPVVIDLHPGSFSSTGQGSPGSSLTANGVTTSLAGLPYDNISIAYDTTIAEAVGGQDGGSLISSAIGGYLIGGKGAFTFTPGGGLTVIAGGPNASADILDFHDPMSDYSITPISGGLKIVDSTGTDGTVIEAGVQTLKFADQSITTASVAGQIDATHLTNAGEVAETFTLAPTNASISGGGNDTVVEAIDIEAVGFSQSSGQTTISDLHGAFVQTMTGVSKIAFADGFYDTAIGVAYEPIVTVLDTPSLSGVGAVGTCADIASNLAGLDALVTSGEVIGISASDFGTISVTGSQDQANSAAIAKLSGQFVLDIAADQTSQITGASGNASVAIFSGDAGTYKISAATGHELSVSNGTQTWTLDGITELQFADTAVFAASTTPPSAGGVSSAQIAALYAAVLGRTPDAAGLVFYENAASENPATRITTYAQWFLASPEYTSNPEHAYAQTAAGEAQFITDTYQNLLDRAPEADAIPYYQNVISKFTAGLTAGTAAYASADALAHATVLTYFSQSGEFLNDVQVTAQNPASPGFTGHWLVLV